MAQSRKKTILISKFVLRWLLFFLHRGSVIHVRNKCSPLIQQVMYITLPLQELNIHHTKRDHIYYNLHFLKNYNIHLRCHFCCYDQHQFFSGTLLQQDILCCLQGTNWYSPVVSLQPKVMSIHSDRQSCNNMQLTVLIVLQGIIPSFYSAHIYRTSASHHQMQHWLPWIPWQCLKTL